MERYAFILLNFEKFWNRLCKQKSGQNRACFCSQRASWSKNVKLLLFYVTHSHKEIRGVGEFIERITGKATELWKNYGHEFLLKSYEEYVDFMQGRRKGPSLGSETYTNSLNPSKQTLYPKLLE